MINIKDFNINNLKLDKKGVLGNDVYYIGYIAKKPQWNVNSVNPLCLMINRIKGRFKEVDGDEYLIISSENGDSFFETSILLTSMSFKLNDFLFL